MNKCLERVNGRHFWNPGVVSYAMIPRCHPNSRIFFFIVTSIVYDFTSVLVWTMPRPWAMDAEDEIIFSESWEKFWFE
jgi:hypothetical protein